MSNEEKNKLVFRYNMSFYYQSTIIYLAAFILYIIIRGEFVEQRFILITKDPIIYFFAIIVLISIASILYNLYKNKHLEIDDDAIAIVDRFRTKTISANQIEIIRLFKERKTIKNRAFRVIRIVLKNRKRPLIIRPYDYENEKLLVETLQKLKLKLEAK